ncbi:phage tail tube protein [Neisseria shayeganii]|uniref:Phage tail protein n=1 Tax=Neisseria shayeganii TaxID=607712 RepID=A0A7D7S988_9NEIS|nr:phage tail tube protein [Neisseria shayeganii]QMT41371.1 hypothetical protein H3L94_04925 [Neisseria shayeganii]
MSNAVLSQGTELFALVNREIVKCECTASITGVGSGTKTEIDITTLKERVAKQYASGLEEPATLSIPYKMLNFKDHKVFENLKKSGATVKWCIALSDGTNPPTASDDDLTAPTERTSVIFSGFVAENSIEFAENDVVKGTLSIKRSGGETWNHKA